MVPADIIFACAWVGRFWISSTETERKGIGTGKEGEGRNNLDKSVHLDQGQAISTEQQQRVEEAVQLAAQPGAPGRRWAERLEDEMSAVPDPEPVVVCAGLDGEAQEVGEAAGVEVAGVDDGASGLEVVTGYSDGSEAATDPGTALEDAELGPGGGGIVGEKEGGGGAGDAGAHDADLAGVGEGEPLRRQQQQQGEEGEKRGHHGFNSEKDLVAQSPLPFRLRTSRGVHAR